MTVSSSPLPPDITLTPLHGNTALEDRINTFYYMKLCSNSTHSDTWDAGIAFMKLMLLSRTSCS